MGTTKSLFKSKNKWSMVESNIKYNELNEEKSCVEYENKTNLAQNNELKLLKELIMYKKNSISPNDSEWPKIYTQVGSYFNERAEYDLALRYHLKAFILRKKTLPDHHPDIAMSYQQIGSIFYKQGNYDKAIVCFNHSNKILVRSLKATSDVAS